MAELKTQPNNASVRAFLDGIPDAKRRKDAKAVARMMRELTGKRPRMWGESIVGYGSYTFTYDSGRSGEWFLTGFSPRKQALTLYVLFGVDDADAMLKKLGKFKRGRSCLYIKRLEDVDLPTLKQLIRRSVKRKGA